MTPDKNDKDLEMAIKQASDIRGAGI